MRVAVVAESFLPHANGVTTSVLRTLRTLQAGGHEAVVIAAGHHAPVEHEGTPVLHVPSIGLPGYPQVRLNIATRAKIHQLLSAVDPDVVHLAAPMLLGHRAMRAAVALDLPTVAVYQTDIAAYAERYGFPGWSERVWGRIVEIHEQADRTLAPSTHYVRELTERGVPRVHRWGRGVDHAQFAPGRRSEDLRRSWGAGPEDVVVGFVGRLAPEKQVEDLGVLEGAGIRVVIIGDGPSRGRLQARLPHARFTGYLSGEALGEAVASTDIVVQPGTSETFCQSVQEALAAGVPVIAPAAGGPLDLIHSSHTGWLYPPGDLTRLRASVLDLAGDVAKRRAFGRAAQESVRGRTWDRLGTELLQHYRAAVIDRRRAQAREG